MRKVSLLCILALFGFGCAGEAPETTIDPNYDGPTYHEHVAPILAKNCASCHQPGNIGPFNFNSYEEALTYRDLIQTAVRSESMPPFPPRTDGSCRELED